MPTDSTNPNWIEPPPPRPRRSGCAGRGCLGLLLAGFLVLLVLVVGGYFFVSHELITPQPAPITVQALPPPSLQEVKERVDQFQATPPASATPSPAAAIASPEETPARQLALSASDINGLIAANRRSRGHAEVAITGNTANVRLSIPSDKVPGFPPGYLNGTFTITTNGPTPIRELQVRKIEANGYPVPSAILTMSVGGHSIIGYALDAAVPYGVTTAEIRDGQVLLR